MKIRTTLIKYHISELKEKIRKAEEVRDAKIKAIKTWSRILKEKEMMLE